MRRRNIILVMVLPLLIVVGCVFAVRYLSGVVPYWQCSEVYRRYAHVEGVEAAFVKGFPINDTLGVDVTLIRATDSAGWDYLMKVFHISAGMVEEAEENPLANIWMSQSLKDTPETRYIPSDSISCADSDIEIIAKAMNEREICIFHTRGAGERVAVLKYNWDEMTKKIK